MSRCESIKVRNVTGCIDFFVVRNRKWTLIFKDVVYHLILIPAYRTLLVLGVCPRIAILSQIKAFLKNTHSHIADIGVCAYLRALYFLINEELVQVSPDSESIFSDRLLEPCSLVGLYKLLKRAGFSAGDILNGAGNFFGKPFANTSIKIHHEIDYKFW